jgi:hypothetical protein
MDVVKATKEFIALTPETKIGLKPVTFAGNFQLNKFGKMRDFWNAYATPSGVKREVYILIKNQCK